MRTACLPSSCCRLLPQPSCPAISTPAEEPEAAAEPAYTTTPAPAPEAPAAPATATAKHQRRSWPAPRPMAAVVMALCGQRKQQQKPCRQACHTVRAPMLAHQRQPKAATRRCHQHQTRPRACC